MGVIEAVLSDKKYDPENWDEPDYDHGEHAVGGDTTFDQVNAMLGGASTVAGILTMTAATGLGGVAVGSAALAAGLYKTSEGLMGIAGIYDIDEKIENNEPHLDSESYGD